MSVELLRGRGAESSFAQRKVDPSEASVELRAEKRYRVAGRGWALAHQVVDQLVKFCFSGHGRSSVCNPENTMQ